MTWILDAAIYGLLLVMVLFCCFYFWFQFYTSGHSELKRWEEHCGEGDFHENL